MPTTPADHEYVNQRHCADCRAQYRVQWRRTDKGRGSQARSDATYRDVHPDREYEFDQRYRAAVHQARWAEVGGE